MIPCARFRIWKSGVGWCLLDRAYGRMYKFRTWRQAADYSAALDLTAKLGRSYIQVGD